MELPKSCFAPFSPPQLTGKLRYVSGFRSFPLLGSLWCLGICLGDRRFQVTLPTGPSVPQARGDGFLGVVPVSRVAMDTSSLPLAFGPPLTF